MRTRLKLFLEWGITFGKPYEIAEQSARKVEYANRHSLEEEIIRRNAACEADPEERSEPDSSASVGIQHTPALEHKAPEQQKPSIRI